MRERSMYVMKHKDKNILTSVGSGIYENHVRNLLSRRSTPGIVPTGYDHRPDLIANIYLGQPDAWWIISEMNAVTDPFEQLNIGDSIRLP